MTHTHHINLDEAIASLSLQPTAKPLNTPVALDSRVFVYPELNNVYIMESDLYGTRMPEGSCYLAFEGQHGLIGRNITIQTLMKASKQEISDMVSKHKLG